jgi:hypothetical protein
LGIGVLFLRGTEIFLLHDIQTCSGLTQPHLHPRVKLYLHLPIPVHGMVSIKHRNTLIKDSAATFKREFI